MCTMSHNLKGYPVFYEFSLYSHAMTKPDVFSHCIHNEIKYCIYFRSLGSVDKDFIDFLLLSLMKERKKTVF